jgi:bifunctional ADP-heptose synthase (sugar kinase/adenylyltransferase)
MSDRHCWTYWPSFHRARVLVLGDVMLDRFVYGSVDRTRPRPRRDGARAHL